jgi:hypothetical protein
MKTVFDFLPFRHVILICLAIEENNYLKGVGYYETKSAYFCYAFDGINEC